jgi:hypothetical protein
VREKGEKTVLVSRDELLPEVVGLPVAAPDGPISVPDTSMLDDSNGSTFIYASPDGSHVYFASKDQLTSAAPAGNGPKEYVFNVDTETLEYVPEVEGPIIASSTDGSRFLFEDTTTPTPELAVWTSGSDGHAATGTIQHVAQLPFPEATETNSGELYIAPARATTSGSIFVFQTDAPIAGFNDAGGYEQIFRYDATQDEITCISCPPSNVVPTGDAHLSGTDDFNGGGSGAGIGEADSRGMSDDGTMVFFDSRDPLVSRDTNGKRDVYEWDKGSIYLISSGISPLDSFFLDTSEDAGDAFFTTAEGLLGSDTDQAYDVYDARVPQPGDTPLPAAVPCQGDVCQGPPSTPNLLGLPASATFSGVENIHTESSPPNVTRQTKSAKPPKKSSHRKVKPRKKIKKRTKGRKSATKATKGNRRGK